MLITIFFNKSFWLRKISIPVWGLAIFALIISASIMIALMWKNPFTQAIVTSQAPPIAASDQKQSDFHWFLDGRVVNSSEEEYARPYAVMIDHSIDSGNASGIDKASVVIETLVEGGVTRLMAFFYPQEEIQEIGPVRSARPYFVDFAQGFGAVYVHAGGSPTALMLIKNKGIDDLNEVSGDGNYFWRDSSKFAPHNLYTASKYIAKAWNIKGWNTKRKNISPWQWKEFTDEALHNGSTISIDFSRFAYSVEWRYNTQTQQYERFVAGKKVLTSDTSLVVSKNILVQFVTIGLEDALRLTMKTIGTGKAYICTQAVCKEGEWKRDNETQPTSFFVTNNGSNEQARLTQGNIWIEIVPQGRAVSFQ